MARSLDELIGNGSNYIDSRDVIERHDELDDRSNDPTDPLDEDEQEELAELKGIVEEGADVIADWQYGEALVPEYAWVDYCRDLAESIGAISGNEGWPLSYIDWDRAAEALRMDYSVVTIRGTDYYGRS